MRRDYQELKKRDKQDVITMAHTNRGPLHYCMNTPLCEDPMQCLLCRESARLAVQHYRPIIEKRVVESLMETYNVRCTLPHPGGD